MEGFIAQCFRDLKWPAEQGIYYTDPISGKEREIDVLCRHYLDRPKRYALSGSPLLNFSIICECKSLPSWNILFFRSEPPYSFLNRMNDHWCGHSEYIVRVVEAITSEDLFRHVSKNRLHTYFSRRGHPDGTQLIFNMHLAPPPVDMVASAFRATKSGNDDRDKLNPLWNAIQSVFSSTKAAELRSISATDSYVVGFRDHGDILSEQAENMAIMYDIELARRVLFHPVIFCRSRMFDLSDDMTELNSVRLCVGSLDFGYRFVDIVQFVNAGAKSCHAAA